MLTRGRIFFAGLAGILLIGVAIYQIPWVKSRFDWRYEKFTIYVRNVVSPPGPVPTSFPITEVPATSTPTVAASPAAAPTIVPTVEPTPATVPPTVVLPAPPWEKQTPNNCGPATLSMALHMFGWKGTQADIAEDIKPVIGDRNVNPEELQYYANNIANYSGWIRMQYRVGGNLATLKRLIAANYPVMIEGTTALDPNDALGPNDDLWAAHYLLLTGYDDASQSVITQDSYHGADLKVSYDRLMGEWKPFNYLYMVLYLPADEGTIKTLLGNDWDATQNRQAALSIAQALVEGNPSDAWAWFNMGSNLVALERYDEAAGAYDKARALPLPLRMFRYQFGPFIAYFQSNRIDDLLVLTKYALGITEMSEETWLWQGWAFYSKGDVAGAVKDWRKALSINPKYGDATYAIANFGN